MRNKSSTKSLRTHCIRRPTLSALPAFIMPRVRLEAVARRPCKVTRITRVCARLNAETRLGFQAFGRKGDSIMPNRQRDLSNPSEKQADLEERLREKGLDAEGRPLSKSNSHR